MKRFSKTIAPLPTNSGRTVSLRITNSGSICKPIWDDTANQHDPHPPGMCHSTQTLWISQQEELEDTLPPPNTCWSNMLHDPQYHRALALNNSATTSVMCPVTSAIKGDTSVDFAHRTDSQIRMGDRDCEMHGLYTWNHPMKQGLHAQTPVLQKKRQRTGLLALQGRMRG